MSFVLLWLPVLVSAAVVFLRGLSPAAVFAGLWPR